MVVSDLDLIGIPGAPSETDTKLVVDPDRIMASSIVLEQVQSIAWRRSQILELMRGIDHCEPPAGRRHDA
jgi:hypothetical protein